MKQYCYHLHLIYTIFYFFPNLSSPLHFTILFSINFNLFKIINRSFSSTCQLNETMQATISNIIYNLVNVMYQTLKKYNIVLRLGQDLHNLQADQQSIFQSFNLPSWLNSTYDLRLLFFGKNEEGIPYYKIQAKAYSFDIGHDVKLTFMEVSKDYDLRIINYEVIDETSISETEQVHKIDVTFQKSRQNRCLFIRVTDQTGILDSVFDNPGLQMYIKKSHLKAIQLEYPYIQPENYRIVEETQKQHLHLAFQGGGVKGFAYIGAYKALKDIYDNIFIKSVIGSSAGSMIALAITAGALPQQLVEIFKQMDNIPKDKIIKSYHDLNSQKQYYYNDIKVKIRRALHDYGLIQNSILDLLLEDVFNNQVIDKLMEVICGSNQSLKEMFMMEVEETIEEKGSCCFSKGRTTRVVSNKLLNYYGLLQGKLMKGKEIEQISGRILWRFLENKFKENPQLVKTTLKIKSDNEFYGNKDKISLLLTMKQFYILSGEIEFTATGVDLDSKILRFFNHKTTPNLPVTKAVQMSGSFPIAFQALKWKKEWGKYYIHYDNVRRELDLQGHTFTDGGMLANFPIMYLDNEQMRPMYFSHKPNDKTKIFGFGLEQIPHQQDPEQIKKHEKAMNELTDLIKDRLPVFKFMWTQLTNTPDPERIPMSSMISLSEIPILGFMIKVMETYLEANQNFVKECFISKIYMLSESYSFARFVMEKQNDQRTLASIGDLIDSLISLYGKLYKQDIGLDHLLKAIGSCIKSLDDGTQIEDILKAKWLITSNLTQYSLFLSTTLRKHSDSQSQFLQFMRKQFIECNNIITQLRDICGFQIIAKAQSHQSDVVMIKRLSQRVKYLFQKRNMREGKLQQKFKENSQQFFSLIKTQLLNSIELIIGELEIKDKIIRTKRQSNYNQMNLPKCNTVYELNKLYTTYPQQSSPQFKLFQKRFNALTDPFMKQEMAFQVQQTSIKHYVQRMIFKRKSNNIHIVFQGKGASTKYYMDIFKLINEEIFMLENTKWKALSEKIARKIIKSTQKTETDKVFQIVDLVVFLVLKNDLAKYVEKQIFNLPDEINLSYASFKIPAEVKQEITEKIQQFKINQCKITSITCSNVHAFLGFMIAGGLKEEVIEDELVKLRDDFETDIISIEQQFKNNDWMVPFKSKVRDFQDIVWKNRYDLFESLEKSMERNKLSLEELDRIKEQFQRSKETISDTFVTILDYIVDIQMSSTSKADFEKDIASKMSLNTKSNNYIQINKKVSEDTKVLINYVFEQFHDQIRLIVLSMSSNHILQFLSLENDVTKRESMWKGIIISKFMKSDRYKHHVRSLLKKMNLPPDINLKQFNEISPRKIQLNFPAVDITFCKQVFINASTHPQMPIWAALLTALSFPVLFPQVRARPGWVEKISKSRAERNLSLFFGFEEDFKASPVLTSGNMLNSFPLELLTNTKMRQRCFEGKQYTFLSFGTKNSPMANNQATVDFNRKFFGFKQTIFLGTKQIVNGLPKMAEAGSVILTKGDYLTGFIDSHDNLMVEMYNKELLRLPIRIGTLDFHILKNHTPLGIPMTTNILEETYYYTLEKFKEDEVTYLKVEFDSSKMKLYFMSKERKCKDLMSKYKVEYKNKASDEYQILMKDQIQVEPRQYSLFLRIHYVDKPKKCITHSEYQLSLSSIAKGFKKFSGVYALPYSKIINTKLNPIANILRQQIFAAKRESGHSISCKSIVNITENGLFCISCCSPISKFKDGVYLQQICNCCSKRTLLKFVCENNNCEAKYCMRCAQYHVIERTKDKLLCHLKHEFEFVPKYNSVIHEGNVRFARCDICLKTTQEYYEDKDCEYRICQPCCANFILI